MAGVRVDFAGKSSLNSFVSQVGDAAHRAVSQGFRRIDRFLAHPLVEPRVGGVFQALSRGSHVSHLLSSPSSRDLDASPLSVLERTEYLLRHMVLSTMLTPWLGGFLYSANPAGIRFTPEDLATMMVRYADLVWSDANRAGRVYPRSLLRTSFADLDASAALQSTLETRRDMMEAISRGDVRSGGNKKYPAYFRQRFHWRDWFQNDSALSWDMMTEILFAGVYGAMQRSALPGVAHVLKNRRHPVTLVELGAGTGTFARYTMEMRRWLGGPKELEYGFIEMSPTNVALARKRLAAYAPDVRFWDYEETGARAESLPYEDASVDVVVAINLFHELPPIARRRTAAEVGRVLKAGGAFVFYDSVQTGDGIDSLLRVFGVGDETRGRRGTFYEPFIASYAAEDLDALFGAAGLRRTGPVDYAYLAKGMVFRKTKLP